MDLSRFFLRESDGSRLMLMYCPTYAFVQVWSPSERRPFGDLVDTFEPPDGPDRLRLSGEHILERTADLLEQGYRLTSEHLFFSDETAPGPQAEWATALDDIVLADRCDLPMTQALIDAFASRSEAVEPCFVEVMARRAVARGQATLSLLGLLDDAVDRLRCNDLDGTPIYICGAAAPQLREALHTTRFALLRTGAPIDDALDAGRRAAPFATLRERIAFFQQHAAEEMGDCWDDLFWMRSDPAYADLTRLDGYVAYHARRVAADCGPDACRWRHGLWPARSSDIARAERTLGVALPDDYRRFLEAGRLRFVVGWPDLTTGVDFAPVDDLVARRANFGSLFVTDRALRIYSGPDEGETVSCDALLWVADCSNQSNSLCARLEAAKPHRWYFWFHDGKHELYFAGETFAAAVARLERAAATKGDPARIFFDIDDDAEET